MLHVEIESAANLSVAASAEDKNKFKNVPDTICVLKFCGRELYRTTAVSNTADPQYLSKFSTRVELLQLKEKENCRPFFMEHFDFEILDLSRVNLGEKIGESRVPLYKTGLQSYAVVKILPSNISSDQKQYDVMAGGRLSIKLTYEDFDSTLMKYLYKIELSKVLSPLQPYYQQLFINFNDTSPSSFVGLSGLPGPTCGEVILDRHTDVEWAVTTHVNAFGDRTNAVIKGSLVLTDIRLLFVPHGLSGPSWLRDLMNIDELHLEYLSEEEIFTLRRLTVQIPISAIDDAKCIALDLTNANIQIFLRDGSNFLFTVKKSSLSLKKHKTGFVDPSEARREASVKKELSDLKEFAVKTGFVTGSVMPQVWCNRVSDEINWMVKEDVTWIRWLSYLKRSVQTLNIDDKLWIRENHKILQYENDYVRQRVQDGNWVLSESNQTYMLCPTYPKVLVFPDVISEEELLDAAADRSIGRLPALVWMHPDNKAALCRSAQPNSGLAGNDVNGDKKLCLAIKAQCPTGLPLRIADARPFLNANANALRGKGIENVNFFGGSSVAVLVFLDIENIHVVKASYVKLKEGLVNPTQTDADDVVVSSKWLYHISTILKGAVAIAESLIIGHPVLIHCSDGWDRTSQLSCLAQIMLDPYYRTLQGFLVIWNKEFVSFGHQFEERLGKYKNSSASQIFVQFCDCMWQMLNQNPNEFEFTPYLLNLVLQSAYSGLFSTFRCDSEQKKNIYMKRAASNFDISLVDLHFSSLFCYIEILMKSPVYRRLIINPFYSPKAVSGSRRVSYICPRSSVNNLSLWRDGILCFYPDLSTPLNLQVDIKPSESVSMSSSRVAHEYISGSSKLLYNSMQTYDKLNSCYFSDEQSQRNRSNNKSFLAMLKDQVRVIYNASDGFSPLTVSVLTLQSWWRAQLETKRMLLAIQSSAVIKSVWVDVQEFEARIGGGRIVKSLRKFIYLLAHYRCQLNTFDKIIKRKVNFDLSRDIVKTIVEETLSRCIHSDELSRQNVLQSLSDLIANSNRVQAGVAPFSSSSAPSGSRASGGGFFSSFTSSSSSSSTSSSSSSTGPSFTLASMWK